MREEQKLNHGWVFKKTDDLPSSYPVDWEATHLPHTWNNTDGQDGGNDYYRGKGMYCRRLSDISLSEDQDAVLSFEAIGMIADIYINGHHVKRHEGGYATVRVSLTEHLNKEAWICVVADNKANDFCYPQKADFTFFGGIYRDVTLMILSKTHFEVIQDGGTGVHVTPKVHGDYGVVTVETWSNGGDEIRLHVGDNVLTVPVIDGKAEGALPIDKVRKWHGVEDPYLYTGDVSLIEDGKVVDSVTVRFGFRTMEFNPEKGFILNGQTYPLRGVSRHQDREDVGYAITEAMQDEDMAMIKEIGANTIRLAHYQHSQYFYDLCDEEGMVVWAEIPYITEHMPNGRDNTLTQMRELVVQNYNHPSIVCWGLSNEITASGSVTEDLVANHVALNNLCHALDSTRPTTMAHVFMLETDSPLIDVPDIGSYNLYFGWYLGELSQNDDFFDDFHKKYPNKVMGFSEYGADANPAFQSEVPDRGDYSEGYQALYHEHILKCIEERPYLWSTHVWNMFDFAADGRDEGGKHGINQKGLVTYDRKLRKDAFYLYKAAWSKESVLHLCGKRYINRHEDQTTIKVYSNSDKVALYVDGVKVEEKESKRVFEFTVAISGEHDILVTDGQIEDSMTIRKATEACEAYRFAQGGGIVNWFDKDDFNPDFFSIKDTIGAISTHPVAGKIMERLMAEGSGNRGDVAESVKDNENLQKMMAQTSLESILKQMTDSVGEDQVRSLNIALQQIKK